MRVQHRFIFAILTIVLMSGTLTSQTTVSNGGITDIVRPVTDTTGYEMEGTDLDSFENWFPERTIQDFMDNSNDRKESQYDLASLGVGGSPEMSVNQLVDPVVVAFDATHGPQYTTVWELQNDLSMFGVELMIMEGEFIIPDGVNALLLSGSDVNYAPEEVDQIFNWFYGGGPRLLWVAGDSDFGGQFIPDSSNAVLESVGSSLRISADAVADDFANDDASYRVAVPAPACEGDLSCAFTEGVGSAMFHGPTSILGSDAGKVVDLNTNTLPGVEVVMRASPDAYALDQDVSGTEYDHFSTNGLFGDYPMMAVQNMDDERFVITSGEAIFSDFNNMYGWETEQGLSGNPNAWNGGFHEGRQLVDNVFAWFGVNRFMPEPVMVTFDATHAPLFTSVYNLQNDLSMFGTELFVMEGDFMIPEGTNVLLLAGSAMEYLPHEIEEITNWFYSEGRHLIWLAGDSDFAGAFQPDSSNAILDMLGSNLRIAADAVQDDFNNDDAPYRVAVQSPVCEGDLSCTFTDGVGSAIFHGPTSVVGYDGAVVDLNTNPLPGVEVVMRTSSDAYALDQDASMTEMDYYSGSGFIGDYAMMAVQDMGNEKFVITSGEAVFSDYKNMYGWETEQGLNGNPNAWNGGFHEGKQLVDNVFTWFGVNRELMFDDPIYIFGNEDFVNWGFPGSGTSEDPYIIEGFSLTNPNDNLINIFDTDAYFVLRDNALNGLGSDWLWGINLYNVKNGLIENNFITGTGTGINLDHSMNNAIVANYIDGNQGGINLWESRENTIDGNTMTNNGWAAVSITNEQPIVWMRFWQDISVTVRDSVVWQASFVDPDEGEIWRIHDNLEVILTLDGENVAVDIWDVYFDDGRGEFRFDMEYWAGSLPLGEHEFETHFFIEGVEYESGFFGHVTVNENAVVPVRFYEDATITEGDQIAWQASWSDPDLAALEEVVAGVEAFLEVNGEPVVVTYSGIYFDDSREIYPDEDRYRFDANYLSDPLEVGEYTFDSVFNEFGDVNAFSSLTTVLPYSVDDNNVVSNNFIGNNGQAMWIDNSNSNFVFDNTIESNWGEAISTWQSHRNVFTDNTIQTNNGLALNINGNENFVSGNIIRWNPMGIGINEGVNNVIVNNEVYGNWEQGIDIWGSSDTLVTENFVYENGMGLSISESYNTQIQFNEIHDNFGDGVSFRDSPKTTISENWIFNNWGAGIWGFRETTLGLYAFGDNIMATDQQSIWWFADSSDWDEGYLQFEHDNLQIYLTIDEVPVEVEMSELWFDDWEGVWRYEIWYNSEPLPVGDHVFGVQFVLNEEYDEFHQPFDLAFESYVNVVPGEQSLDENIITLNNIFNNGWVGIGLDSIKMAQIDTNNIHENGGQGVWIGQSTQIEVTNNFVWSNWADAGINFYMTADSLISGNEVFEHFSNGILFEHSSSNHILSNELYSNDVGIWLTGSSENTISDNTINDGGAGIGLFENSNQNLVSYNTVHDLWDDGIGGWDSHGNLIFFNEIYNVDDGMIFRFSNDNIIANNYIHHNRNRGIFLTSEPWEPVQMRFSEDVTVSDVESISWQATSAGDDPDYLQFEHDSMIVELTVDGEPVWVDKSVVWFDWEDGQFKYDMNYFSGPLPIGDHEFKVKFILSEGYDEDRGPFEFEVTAIVTVIPHETSSSGNIIYRNIITDSAIAGIQLIQADGNVISRNDITRSGFGGIGILNSDGNIIRKNKSYENGFSGIFLSDSHYNYVSRNQLFQNGYAGVGLVDGASNNHIARNDIFENQLGVSFEFANNNYLRGNEIEDNGWGVYLEFSNSNSVSRNDIEENNYGIYLWNSHENEISTNDIEENVFGILLEESNYNSISRNDIEDNEWGIVLRNSHENEISRNDIEDNYVGILFEFSNYNFIYGNDIEDNEYGLVLIYSNNNSIERNEIEDNTTGVYLYYSYDNEFSRNEFDDNTDDWVIIE